MESASDSISQEVRRLARVLWDYHNLDTQLPAEVDLLLVAGSHDDRVADYAAQTALNIHVKIIVTSGGYGKITGATRRETEAARFAEIMVKRGVARDSIITEPAASNMGENVVLTRQLTSELGLPPISTGLIVTKPYMKRRALSTAQKQWSDVSWDVCAPEITFEDYASADVPERQMIELLVGDTQRIWTYAESGFQVSQAVPENVTQAYNDLVSRGFTRFVS